MAKSPNKHNRVYVIAKPVGDELCEDIENDKVRFFLFFFFFSMSLVRCARLRAPSASPRSAPRPQVTPSMEAKDRARCLIDSHGWDKEETRKLWCFGPDGTGPNIVVDATKAVQVGPCRPSARCIAPSSLVSPTLPS